METKDHLLLADIIVKTAGESISAAGKNAFTVGCIEPDINLLTYTKGHTYKATADDVKYTIRRLFGRLRTPRDYFLLGRAVHYMGDYFTFPHSPGFLGNLKEHIEYERKLHRHISDRLDLKIVPQSLPNSCGCISFLEGAHEKYLKASASLHNDWSFIKTVCLSVSSAAMSRDAQKSVRGLILRPGKLTT